MTRLSIRYSPSRLADEPGWNWRIVETGGGAVYARIVDLGWSRGSLRCAHQDAEQALAKLTAKRMPIDVEGMWTP